MSQSTVLIVDDNPENLTVLGELLCGHYRVLAANSGARALQLAAQPPLPDLILLDIMMPGMSGHEVLQVLQADARTRDVPVIFITAMTGADDEQRGLALGAVDYIGKPLHPAIVLARVRMHLELKHARDLLRRDNAALEAEIARRMHENEVAQDVTILALARLAEMRDNETGDHVRRTQEYVLALARRAAALPRFAAALDEASIAVIAKSALLRDVGKVGIPDHILLKPGKLTPQERDVIRTHSRLGADAIERAVADTHEPVPFLACARDIALYHHERWDGSGYPEGLAGEAIPLPARLMALADVFDALSSPRIYKAPMPLAQVREVLARERGRHFDPDLLDCFLDGFDTFCDIARRYSNRQAPAPAQAAAA
jgi:putative two-component system response regulator